MTITEEHYTDLTCIERRAAAIKVVGYSNQVTSLIKRASVNISLGVVAKRRK